tara:strand:+ start:850 stop:1281 length:432 start_codon:yes stop_codon:yes gene_type:complete
MTICYLGLGSNLHAPQRQLGKAIKEIQSLPYTTILKQSSLYHTKPLGFGYQPDYYNQAISIKTRLTAVQVLSACQLIEKKHRRVKKKIWGPRTLDIDILLFGYHTCNLPHLKIPHPEMLNRDFVLQPILEINPDILLLHQMAV